MSVSSKRKMDILVLSDIHLGTYGCHAKELLSYLKSIKPKVVVLNGDIIENLTALEYYNEEWHIYQHIDHGTDLEQESDDELNTKILFDNLLQELSLEAESN